MLWRVNDLREGYRTIVSDLIDFGTPVAPRGQPTLEVLGATIVLANPYDALPVGIGRTFSPRIAAAEALQLIGGVSHPEVMRSVAPRFEQFQDGGTFHAPYGERTRSQIPAIVERLRNDPDTRQAVVTLWDPQRDTFEEGLKDYPCTVMLQFMIRDSRLVMQTTMRSNDVWWGLAHDAFQFTQLQISIAAHLQIDVGPYYHHAGSLHIYQRDLNDAAKLHPFDAPRIGGLNRPAGLGEADRTWQVTQTVARDLLRGEHEPTTQTEEWYIDQLSGHTTADLAMQA